MLEPGVIGMVKYAAKISESRFVERVGSRYSSEQAYVWCRCVVNLSWYEKECNRRDCRERWVDGFGDVRCM